MRYCKRTFFNRIFQPKRIGKPIYKIGGSRYVREVHERRMWGMCSVRLAKRTMLDFRRGKTPKNSIIGRHSTVKCYQLHIRKSPSIFVRRAKHYAIS